MKRWLALLAACGSSDKPDPMDAGPSTGSVTVVVTARGKPVVGLPVHFTGNDGTQFSAVTSAEGACGFSLEGFVTVHFPRSRYGVDHFTTFSNLIAGNTVHLDLEPPGPQAYDVAVTVPADPANASQPHLLYTSCAAEEPWGVTPAVARSIAIQCATPRVDMLVVTIDPDTAEPRGSLFVPDLDVSTGAVDLVPLAGSYTAVDRVTISYPNLAPPYQHAASTHLTLSARGRTFEAFANSGNVAAVPPDPPQPLFRVLATGADQLVATSAHPAPTDFDEQIIFDIPPPTGPFSVDMSRRLPGYVNEEPDGQRPPIVGRYDFATQQLRWSHKSAGPTATFVRARLRFTREPVPQQGNTWIWDIVAPRTDEPAVALPRLGAPAEAFNPGTGDVVAVEQLTNVLLPPGVGYADILDHAFDPVDRLVPRHLSPTIVQQRYLSAE